MISVERYRGSADRVSLTLRVEGVDRSDLDGVGGAVQPAAGPTAGIWLVSWDWPRAMAPADPVAACTTNVTEVLTAAALTWLGNGGTIDLTGGTP